MKIRKLVIQNFLSIGTAILEFTGSGLVLIEGENKDSPSSVSNGSGKSSLYEGLHYCFWGKTKRGVGGDDVVNNVAKKECLVSVEFDDYILTRYRKHSTGENGLVLQQQNSAGDWVDLSKGTVRETQALVESILKMSELTFGKIAHFGQEDVIPFATMGDAQLKEVFEQALGLEFLTEKLQMVKQYRAEQDGKLAVFKASIERKTFEHDALKEKLTYLGNAERQLNEQVGNESKRLNEEHAGHMASLVSLAHKVAELRQSHVDSSQETERLKGELAKLKEVSADIERKRSAATSILNSKEIAVAMKSNEVAQLLQDLKKTSALVGAPCGECKKPYEEADVAPRRDSLTSAIRSTNSGKEEARAQAEAQKRACVELEGTSGQLAEAISLTQDKLLALAQKSAGVGTIEENERQQAEVRAKMVKIDEAIKNLAGRENPYAKDLADTNDQLYACEKDVETHRLGMGEILEELSLVKQLEDIFGNGGMKSYLMDNITPELNRLVNEYAQMLDDISIEVSTMTKLKTGEYREKFHIAVDNRHGAKSYRGSSGGEKQKINLPIALAFNGIVRSMAGNPLNVLFLDEPFESLDEGSSERVLELIKMLALENVFLVTHQNAVKDLVPRKIRVVKKYGMAKIENSTCKEV